MGAIVAKGYRHDRRLPRLDLVGAALEPGRPFGAWIQAGDSRRRARVVTFSEFNLIGQRLQLHRPQAASACASLSQSMFLFIN